MCPRRRRDASLSRRVPKPVDFPFERFPESDDIFNLIADRLRRRLRNQGLLSQFSRQAGITSARKIANAVAVADGGPVNAQTRYLPVHA
ncbi:hypothetical protein ALC57_17379 [Trachymyrmex cornetzi]|uniref:Uncharacterized protein n=1 Tax=Trachymyrmex cornetzi TaxID=471704 RepID=A0A195DD64_9HYME|nr:hypothetical protein ALC57_17379 [Trachymyrmex cornetzi]